MAAKKVAQTVIKEDKFYTISSANGKVVEVADYNIDNGARVQLWDNANAEWQQWGFVRAGEASTASRTVSPARCWTCTRAASATAPLSISGEGAPASSQLWIVEPGNDGRVKIKSNLAGKCLDVVGMATDNGAGLQIWADVNGDNQFWTIAK